MATRTQAEVDAYLANLFAAGRAKVGGAAVVAANQQTQAAAQAEFVGAYNDYNTLINSGSATEPAITAAETRLSAATLARNQAKLLPTSMTALNNNFTWAGTNFTTVENEFYNQIGV